MPDCTPPHSVPEETLCVLRRRTGTDDCDFLIGYWALGRWRIPLARTIKAGAETWSVSQLGAEGWYYAGICPDLPDEKPMTAAEIAQDALDNCLSSALATEEWRANYYANALRRIAGMKP